MDTETRVTPQSNWLQTCFVVMIALLPFVYSAKGVDPVLIPRQIFVSLLVMLFAGVLVFKLKKEIVIQSIIPILLVVLSMLYLISITQAVNRIESDYIVLKISVFVAYFLVMYIGFKEGFLNIRSISLAIAISGLLATGLAIRDMVFLQTQGVDLFKDRNIYKVNATFGHKNLLSAYIFLCLPMVVMQMIYNAKLIWKLLLGLGTLVMIGILLVLQTRAVLLAALVCSCFSSVLIVRSRILSSAQRKFGLAALLLFLLAAIASGYVFREKLTNLTRTESFIERKHVWENTWQMITDYPVGGVGAANWQIHFPKYGMQKFYEVNYTISEGLTNFQRPHNDFLWVWAEIGTLGFVVYALIFLLSGWYAYQLFTAEKEIKGQVVYGLVLLQLIGFVVISLVDFPLERIEHPVVILTSIACVAAESPRMFYNLKLPKWSLLLLVLLGVYSLFICSNRWKSELTLRNMYRAHSSKNWVKLVEEGKRAQTEYLNMDYFSIPVNWYVGVGYFMQNNLVKAKENFEEAYLLHPYQVHVLNNYGACYEKEGNHIKAIEMLETACQISPTFTDGVINLSGSYFNAGRYEDAYNRIITIGYDDNNPRLITFQLAIVKRKFEREIQENPNTGYATFLKNLSTDDKAILKHYKYAKENQLVFLEYLKKEATQSKRNVF